MPENKKVNAAAEVSLRELQSLNPEVLKELQDKHGLEVSIRSNVKAIDQILGHLGRKAVGTAAEFTRGFDRTSDCTGSPSTATPRRSADRKTW